MAYILAAFAGVISVFSKIVNVDINKRIGTKNGAMVNYLFGSVFSFVFMVIINKSVFFSGNIASINPIYYLGGLFGLFAFLLLIHGTKKTSITYSTILALLGQLASAMVIDYFVLNKFNPLQIVGVIIVVIGIWLDNKSANENRR